MGKMRIFVFGTCKNLQRFWAAQFSNIMEIIRREDTYNGRYQKGPKAWWTTQSDFGDALKMVHWKCRSLGFWNHYCLVWCFTLHLRNLTTNYIESRGKSSWKRGFSYAWISDDLEGRAKPLKIWFPDQRFLQFFVNSLSFLTLRKRNAMKWKTLNHWLWKSVYESHKKAAKSRNV